jgi:hypothetical protein
VARKEEHEEIARVCFGRHRVDDRFLDAPFGRLYVWQEMALKSESLP